MQFMIFNFSANPDITSIHCTQFLVEFTQFWIFNFSANPDVPNIYNVHNFLLNFRSSGYLIFMQIQTFRTYIMYTISRWIFAVLYVQFSANHYIPYIECTQFPVEFTLFWIIKFFANPDIPHIQCIQFTVEFS